MTGDVERKAREWSAEERYLLRQRIAAPVLGEFRVWMERERADLLPKSPLGGAIRYTLSNWAALGRYCENGDLPIDNNASERSLRGVAVGRGNWMFFGSDQGGKTAAVLNGQGSLPGECSTSAP